MATPAQQSLLDILSSFQHGHPEEELKKTEPLFHNLLMTIFRHRVQMDWLVDSRSRKRLRPDVRTVLWWALAEILWLDGIPDAVAVDTAVDFIKKRSAGEGRFANAVLRGICREKETLFHDAPDHVRAAIPLVLWKRWQRNFSAQTLEGITNALQKPAETVLRLNGWMPDANAEDDIPLLQGLRPLPPPEWAPTEKIYLADELPLESRMASGKFYIQDPATLLAPHLLRVSPGENVADLCCAPGGKSRILTECLRGQGRLLCADKAQERLPLVRRNLQAYPNVTIRQMDAAQDALPDENYDAILLDVPCSNTGVIRRKPDVRFAFTEKRLLAHTTLQQAILGNAARALRPGGRICYSTCSIEPEENRRLVDAFLARHPEFSLVQDSQLLPTAGTADTPGHDGAYAALLCKSHR